MKKSRSVDYNNKDEWTDYKKTDNRKRNHNHRDERKQKLSSRDKMNVDDSSNF